MAPGYLASSSSRPSVPKLEKVMCYLSDSSSIESFPKRAYSVGSKPKQNNALDRNYLEMNLGSSEWSTTSNSNEKCSSAPHLPPEEGSVPPRRVDSDDYYQANTDLFMELEFNSKTGTQKSENGGKASLLLPNNNSAQEFRLRTSSAGSKDLRQKALAGSALAREQHARMAANRTRDSGDRLSNVVHALIREEEGSECGPLHRQRTATIAQDSLRPRTSSFNVSDMRPRSSSHGTRFRDFLNRRVQERTQTQSIAMQMLQNSISSENVSETSMLTSFSGAAGDYLEMDKSSRSTPTSSIEQAPVNSSPNKSTSLASCGDYITVEYDSGRGSRNSINVVKDTISTEVGEKRDDAYVQYSPSADNGKNLLNGTHPPATLGSLQKVISYVGWQSTDRPNTPGAGSPTGPEYVNVDYGKGSNENINRKIARESATGIVSTNNVKTVSGSTSKSTGSSPNNSSVGYTATGSRTSTNITVTATAVSVSGLEASLSSFGSVTGNLPINFSSHVDTDSSVSLSSASTGSTVSLASAGHGQSMSSTKPTNAFSLNGKGAAGMSVETSDYACMSFSETRFTGSQVNGEVPVQILTNDNYLLSRDQLDSVKAKPLPTRPLIPLPPKPVSLISEPESVQKCNNDMLLSNISDAAKEVNKSLNSLNDKVDSQPPFPLDTLVKPIQLVASNIQSTNGGIVDKGSSTLKASIKSSDNAEVKSKVSLPITSVILPPPLPGRTIDSGVSKACKSDSRPASGTDDSATPTDICYATLALPTPVGIPFSDIDARLPSQKPRSNGQWENNTTYTEIDFCRLEEMRLSQKD